jgi:hypothetical protein
MNNSIQPMLSIGFNWKDVSSVSKGDQLFLIDGLKIFSVEKGFEHSLCFLSDPTQPMADI